MAELSRPGGWFSTLVRRRDSRGNPIRGFAPAFATANAAKFLLTMKSAFSFPLSFFVVLTALTVGVGQLPGLELKPLGTLKLGAFDEGAAEMAAFHAGSKRLFAVNGEKKSVSVIDLSDPSAPKLVADLDISEYGKSPTCVDCSDALVAVSVANDDKQAAGKLVFFTIEGELAGVVEAGALPDHVTFSPDGNWCLAANEGEPSDDYQNDPEGSVTIVDVSSGKLGKVTQVSLGDLEPEGEGVRVFGPGASLAQDLEPEFVAVSPDSKTAWVVCQENNAVVTIDIEAGKAHSLKGLGTKDHSQEGKGFDASNKTGTVMIQPWPTRGMYQPDSTIAFEVDGKAFIATANEGDGREYLTVTDDGEEEVHYTDEARVEDLKLDPEAFPNAEDLQQETQLGRLKVTNATGDTDGDGDIDVIHSFGARSFSIWDADWNLVFDSGNDFERVTAEKLGQGFNSTNDEQPSFKDRSDDKGPEPEALIIGMIEGKTYAFIGMERVGGVFVYDVSDPAAAKMVTYANRRDFEADIESEEAGDLGPEDLVFIAAEDSPTGKPLLVVASEVSGTIGVMEIVP